MTETRSILPDWPDGFFRDVDTDILLNIWEDRNAQIDILMREKGHVEMEISRRMHDDDATVLRHDQLECKLGTASYDPGRLKALAELVPPAEFARAYTAAHTETKTVDVAEKFDMRIITAWGKLGKRVATAIKDAELLYSRRLTIKVKEGK